MSKPSNKPSGEGALPGQPNIHIPESLETSYSNMVRIAHTPTEMVFDFARILPGDKMAMVLARVLMSPLSAKLLLNALNENLSRYEATFGEIKLPKKNSLASNLFKPPQQPEE